ncbi:MAG: PadR family transcriptional regulator [Gemmatimonadota bacterium]
MAGSNIYTGTLDLLILQTLKWGPKHGYAIGRWISERTEGAYDLEEGVLYPALHRLNKKGWVKGQWGETDTGRRARFYSLTKRGWKALQRETARWEEHVGAVAAVLHHSGGELSP